MQLMITFHLVVITFYLLISSSDRINKWLNNFVAPFILDISEESQVFYTFRLNITIAALIQRVTFQEFGRKVGHRGK